MNALEQQKMKLKYIEKERKTLLGDIRVAQSRIAELNRQRQNIIMKEE
jgi:hypothetical protein